MFCPCPPIERKLPSEIIDGEIKVVNESEGIFDNHGMALTNYKIKAIVDFLDKYIGPVEVKSGR